MIGGSPMVFAQQRPVILPQGASAAPWQPAGTVSRTPQTGLAVAPPAPSPKFRAQMGDEPERRTLSAVVTLPTPEQLGVSKPRAKDGSADWVDARRRLDTLGALAFQVAKTPRDGWRFDCLLPTDQHNYNHRIEAEAATEAEAVRLGLERAEDWARQR